MEATDAAESIQEAAEGEVSGNERLRRRAAVVIGVLAMLLAITSLGGDDAQTEMTQSNILASDTWAFYQAKNIRQTSFQLAAEELEVMLLTQPNLPPEARADIQQRIERYRATVARYESDPVEREGKRELFEVARAYEGQRERAGQQDPNFDYAQALFQIAIVLGSVSIVAASRALLWFCLGLGALATLLMINGFFLITELPFV